jgi:hypothetical protein
MQLAHRGAVFGRHAVEPRRVAGGEREHLGHVHAHDMLWIDPPDLRGDHRAGVVAGCAVTLVAEAVHQRGPGRGGPLGAPAPAGERGRERESGQRRDHQVERVRRVGAVGSRVGQRADHIEELDDRARPAMGQDQRERVRLGRPDVQEVDVLAVDLGDELRVLVQPGLGRTPVKAVPPVPGQPADFGQRHPVRLRGRAGDLGRPAHPVQPVPQVI